MENNKQTDMLTWKERLEGLAGLPEPAFAKDAAWEKLSGRLQGPVARRKLGWYWAAACFVLLMAIPFLLIRRSSHVTPQAPLVKQPASPAISSFPDTLAQTGYRQPALVQQPVLASASASGQRRKQHHSTRITILKPDTVSITPDAIQLTIVAPADTAVVMMVAMPAKKKLPVVHINELGKQEQENAKFATHSDGHSLKLKWLSPDNNTGNSISPAADADMIKIKIPLKN